MWSFRCCLCHTRRQWLPSCCMYSCKIIPLSHCIPLLLSQSLYCLSSSVLLSRAFQRSTPPFPFYVFPSSLNICSLAFTHGLRSTAYHFSDVTMLISCIDECVLQIWVWSPYLCDLVQEIIISRSIHRLPQYPSPQRSEFTLENINPLISLSAVCLGGSSQYSGCGYDHTHHLTWSLICCTSSHHMQTRLCPLYY